MSFACFTVDKSSRNPSWHLGLLKHESKSAGSPPLINWLFLLGYQVRSASAPVPASPISVISRTCPGFRHRDRTIIEKNPARYQETSWFPGSKTLKNFLFLLKGASEIHGMQPQPTPPPWTRRRRLMMASCRRGVLR